MASFLGRLSPVVQVMAWPLSDPGLAALDSICCCPEKGNPLTCHKSAGMELMDTVLKSGGEEGPPLLL